MYMTCCKYKVNCQVLKCRIHEPVPDMAGITQEAFSGPLTYILHVAEIRKTSNVLQQTFAVFGGLAHYSSDSFI